MRVAGVLTLFVTICFATTWAAADVKPENPLAPVGMTLLLKTVGNPSDILEAYSEIENEGVVFTDLPAGEFSVGVRVEEARPLDLHGDGGFVKEECLDRMIFFLSL